MRVSRHRRVRSLLRTLDDHTAQLGEFVPQLIRRRSHVQPKVGRDLFVPATSTVQLVSHVADERSELLLDEVMNVFCLAILQKRRRRSRPLADL
jgi:hypothetical protein